MGSWMSTSCTRIFNEACDIKITVVGCDDNDDDDAKGLKGVSYFYC